MAMAQLGVTGVMSGDEPTTEAEYIARVTPEDGKVLPPWSAVLDAKLSLLKANAKQRVATRADQIAAIITGQVPLAEQLSWTAKESAALAHQAGTATATQTALLTAEATVVGETVAELVTKILANAALYHTASGMIAGQRRKTMAAIDALTNAVTFETDVAAIFATAQAEAAALLASLNP